MRAIEVGLKCLVHMGVNRVFGIPAGSINALYDAMIDIPEIESVIVKHETSAGYMAAAYTRITGIPSVCVGSSGPGATNLVTAAANAWVQKIPVIFITGSVPSTRMGKGGAQELGAEPIFHSITKLSKTVLDAKRLPEILLEAYQTAISGVPGPVHLAIPINIQMKDIGDFNLPITKNSLSLLPSVDNLTILRTAQMIGDTGSKGVILLGHGAKNATSSIIRFAEYTGWKVATTPRGKGAFPDGHPLALGVYGLAGNSKAIDCLNSSEHTTILVVGSSLGELSTGNWEPKLMNGKKLIQIDIDSTEFGKNYIPNIAVCGDAKVVIDQILENIGTFHFSNAIKNTQTSIERVNQYEDFVSELSQHDWNTKNAIRLIGALSTVDTRFYCDIGELMTYAIQNLCISDQQKFDVDINFGAMGSAIGGAIGAKLAEPDRPIICMTGDGSFFMHGMEILTAKEYKLPIVFVVINNSRLGMVYHGHMLQYKRCHDEFSQERTNISSVVQSLGICSFQVNSLEELSEIPIKGLLSSLEPVVIEVNVEGLEIPPMGERVKFLQGATY
jgi:acetolactate synthase I/II/III large subunit